jgi:hypothetical protein
MSQVPQKSAPNDQKLRGKNYFEEARGTPEELNFATQNEDSGQPSLKPIWGFPQARSHCDFLSVLAAAKLLPLENCFVGAPFSAYPFEPSPRARTPKKERPLRSNSTIAPLPNC